MQVYIKVVKLYNSRLAHQFNFLLIFKTIQKILYLQNLCARVIDSFLLGWLRSLNLSPNLNLDATDIILCLGISTSTNKFRCINMRHVIYFECRAIQQLDQQTLPNVDSGNKSLTCQQMFHRPAHSLRGKITPI